MKSNTYKKMINTVMTELKDRLDAYTQHNLDNKVNSVFSAHEHALCIEIICNYNVHI